MDIISNISLVALVAGAIPLTIIALLDTAFRFSSEAFATIAIIATLLAELAIIPRLIGWIF